MRELEKAIETADTAERTKLTARLSGLTETAARITVRDLTTGAERTVETGAMRKSAARLAGDGVVVFSGSESGTAEQIYLVQDGAAAAAATTGEQREDSAGRQRSGHCGDLHSPRPGPARRRRPGHNAAPVRRPGAASGNGDAGHRIGAGVLSRRPLAGVRDAHRAQFAAPGRAGRQSRSRHRRPHRARTARRALVLARCQAASPTR